MMAQLQPRDLRQREILPPARLRTCRTTVVGVGAIGRQVALQLAAMGVGSLQLIDPDVVEVVNLASQGYLEADLLLPKVDATAQLCRQINSEIDIEPVQERYRKSMDVGEALFLCVDRIDTRRFIFEQSGRHAPLMVDGRMSAETLRVLACADEPGRRHYATTLFVADEAFTGSCTGKSTIYCANVAAGLMVAQFARWLRDLPVEVDQVMNLMAGEWTHITST